MPFIRQCLHAYTQAGNDVVTQVVNRRIKWGNYKIDPKRDRIGVFVSIVSTKVRTLKLEEGDVAAFISSSFSHSLILAFVK